MSKVKILLDKGETVEEAEQDLIKSLSFQSSGDVHDEEQFNDPAMNEISDKILAMHEAQYQKMLQEIFETLNEDYTG